MAIVVDVFGLTDRGKVRETNEDQFFVADLEKILHIRGGTLTDSQDLRVSGHLPGRLFLVADGVGGAMHGEVASQLASEVAVRYVSAMMPWFYGLHADEEDDLTEHLESALKRCQQQVGRLAADQPEGEKMGTTLTMVYAVGWRFYVVHVGDSRCYQLSKGELNQLTTDHTLAQRLVEEGVIKRSQRASSPYANVLANVIGGGEEGVEPEVSRGRLQAGDSLLLCTDGLTDSVSEEAIREILVSNRAAEDQCVELVRAANDAGGGDNITVIVGRFADD